MLLPQGKGKGGDGRARGREGNTERKTEHQKLRTMFRYDK